MTLSLLALCLQSTDPLKSARLFTVCCWNIMYTRFFSFWIHQYESTLHYTWHETGGSAGEAESDKSRKAWDIFFSLSLTKYPWWFLLGEKREVCWFFPERRCCEESAKWKHMNSLLNYRLHNGPVSKACSLTHLVH